MKKIILIFICTLGLLGITGCGSNEPIEYTENMQKMRSYTAGYIDNKTIGEILDVALINAKWEETPKQGATKSGKIIVKGKDQKTKVDVELTWLTATGMYEDNGFDTFTKDGEKLTYGDFLDYLKEYVNEVN